MSLTVCNQRILFMAIDNEVLEPKVEGEEGFVSKKAYGEVSNDMHKYKAKLKETEAILNQLKAEKEQAEINEKKEKQQWELLYKSNEEKLKQIERERMEEKNKFLNYHKKQAVVSGVGGFKKEEYSSFINVDSVQIDENGNVVQESLDAEVNRIRQNYPDLLKGNVSAPLPNEAPKSFNQSLNTDITKMSERERTNYKMSLLAKKAT